MAATCCGTCRSGPSTLGRSASTFAPDSSTAPGCLVHAARGVVHGSVSAAAQGLRGQYIEHAFCCSGCSCAAVSPGYACGKSRIRASPQPRPMQDIQLGARFRGVRLRLGLRQQDVAARARVSDASVSRIERGHLDALSLRTLRAVAAVLEIRVELLPRWRGGDLDRMVSARHARLAEVVVRWLRGADGWAVRPEVSFCHLRRTRRHRPARVARSPSSAARHRAQDARSSMSGSCSARSIGRYDSPGGSPPTSAGRRTPSPPA